LAQASADGLGADEGALAEGAAADAAVLADGLAPAVVQPATASVTRRTTDDVSALRMLESPLVPRCAGGVYRKNPSDPLGDHARRIVTSPSSTMPRWVAASPWFSARQIRP
jgi:hypothetical protein